MQEAPFGPTPAFEEYPHQRHGAFLPWRDV